MGQTAKYCAECSAAFSKLPVYQQNEKQKEFGNARHIFYAGSPMDYQTLRTEMGVCEDYPETNIIGLSENAATENQEALKRAGAAQLLSKEATVEELYDAICKLVKP